MAVQAEDVIVRLKAIGDEAGLKRFKDQLGDVANVGGRGERLKVIWPGAGWDSSGPREHRADVLPMMALLHGDAMVDALMREVERMANNPLPPAARKRRIGELEAEIEELQRQALVLGAEPSADFAPWVLLGVKPAVAATTPRSCNPAQGMIVSNGGRNRGQRSTT
jgi:hypothetical protein